MKSTRRNVKKRGSDLPMACIFVITLITFIVICMMIYGRTNQQLINEKYKLQPAATSTLDITDLSRDMDFPMDSGEGIQIQITIDGTEYSVKGCNVVLVK